MKGFLPSTSFVFDHNQLYWCCLCNVCQEITGGGEPCPAALHTKETFPAIRTEPGQLGLEQLTEAQKVSGPHEGIPGLGSVT